MSEGLLPKIEQVPHPDGWDFRDVQLEISLKPFYDATSETREKICSELFHQWQPLWRHAESVSVLLWIAEGSEILEYDGDMATTFEWARYHGAPNRHRWELPRKIRSADPDHNGIGINTAEYDPEGVGIHTRAYLYRDEPAVFTFAWLRDLVADLKRIGGDITGKAIYVGETFDIGPEFAKSRFKFDWHREILGDGPVFKEQFISCEAVLKGDDRSYAGYPEGIPDGTRFGTFFGRQLNTLFADMGFDFLWLSNGFGFSLEPWAMVGEVFNGAEYHPERAADIQSRILRFWKDLRAEFPLQYGIRSRGTNMATGIDLGSDASPLKHIYEGGFNVNAPVNSPWAALDGDFGLELSGWMSHVARHPGDTFRYRFYIHDPWWLNSPYLDRYARQPHDIFLPLSVSRLQRDGSVEIPRDMAFLSVDDSHGRMPLTVPNEVTAHILRAREMAPDAPGPLVWVYPFDEYHSLAGEGGRPDIPLHADAYVGTVINQGVPLNTVADLANLDGMHLSGTVLFSPVPMPGSAGEQMLKARYEAGAELLLFGPLLPGSVFLRPLGIELKEPLKGDFALDGSGLILRHTGFLSGGAFTESPQEGCDVLLAASQDGERRVVTARAGHLVWTRASLSTAEYDPAGPAPIKGPILKPLDPAVFYPPGRLVREALRCFGWQIDAQVNADEKRPPYLTVHRHRNALVLSGYHRDEHAVLKVRHPLGAPLLMDRRNRVVDGLTQICGQTAWQHEVRVLVERGADSTLQMRTLIPAGHGVYRRMLISGCENAKLNILPDPGSDKPIRILRDPHFPYYAGEFVAPVKEETPWGTVISVDHVQGELLVEF